MIRKLKILIFSIVVIYLYIQSGIYGEENSQQINTANINNNQNNTQNDTQNVQQSPFQNQTQNNTQNVQPVQQTPNNQTQTQPQPEQQAAILTPPTQEELNMLQIIESEFNNYQRRSEQYSGIVNSFLRREYLQKRERISEEYNRQIQEEQRLIIESRRKAIEYYEAFISRYPNNPRYTPDAMFRLGELYYEDSYETYLEGGEGVSKDYSRTIDLYRRLLTTFSNYPHADGVLYVMGYCLDEMGDYNRGRYAYLNIVCSNKYRFDQESDANTDNEDHPSARLLEEESQQPFVDPYQNCQPLIRESHFNSESWMRIGEFHFDSVGPNDLQLAIISYLQVMQIPDSPLFEKALYKLAWSYYRNMQYTEALRRFTQLVDYSDELRARTGQSSQMRPEAIQYLAICFSEDDWNGDNVPDSIPGFDGHPGVMRIQDTNLLPQDREWTPEVYFRLGGIYFEQGQNKYNDAIRIYRLALQKWPTSPRAPWIQERIALCYQGLHMDEEALEARRQLGENYGPNSEWAVANRERPELVQNAMQLTENTLIETAISHHRRAQNMRREGIASGDEELLQRARNEYQLAANEYREYLNRFPNTPDAYELSFNLADALFFSGNYLDSAREYARVRDSNLDNRYQEDAAFRSVKSYEQLLEEAKTRGQIQVREDPPQVEGQPPNVQSFPIPQTIQDVITARDEYIRLFPNTERAILFRYQNAQLFYWYGQWDEARRRYAEIYQTNCDLEVARFSWETLMNIANSLNDIATTEELASQQVERRCGGTAATQETGPGTTIAEAQRVLTAAQFRRAMDKFSEAMNKNQPQLFEDAAGMLIAAVDANPDHPESAGALNNAGIAFQKAGRYESAMQQFKRIVNDSRYSQSEFMDNALYQLADNAFRFFEYEEAVNSYKIVAGQQRFNTSKYRAPSVLNTAIILTNLGRYREAVPFWQQYAKLPTNLQDAPNTTARIEAEFNVADMQRRMKQWREMIPSMNNFIKSHREKEAASYRVKGQYYISQAYKELRNDRDYWKSLSGIIDEFQKSGLSAGHNAAEYAAEADFLIVDKNIKELEDFQLKGRDPNEINKNIDEIKQMSSEFIQNYNKIKNYGRPNWTVAVLFRNGYVLEITAKTILTATDFLNNDDFVMNLIPSDVKKLMTKLPREKREEMIDTLKQKLRDTWGEKLREMLSSQEELAIKAYEACVMFAKEGNIVNQWTEKAYQRLYSYLPEKYPPMRSGEVTLEVNKVATNPLSSGALEQPYPKILENKTKAIQNPETTEKAVNNKNQ